MNWDDYKFKSTPIPMKIPDVASPAPQPVPSQPNYGVFDTSRMPGFGKMLGLFGQHIFKDSNPQAMSLLNSPFLGPMLGGIFGMGGSSPETSSAPPVLGTDPVALSQAERIKELTSYLTNKKLGT